VIVRREHVAAWLRNSLIAEWDAGDRTALHGALHRGRGHVALLMVNNKPVDGEFVPEEGEPRCPLCKD
jgi:hypothetical protein